MGSMVSLIVSTYLYGEDGPWRLRALAATLASLGAQTLDDWGGVVVHNGPDPLGLAQLAVDEGNLDDRLAVWAAPEAKGAWGHPWRLDGARRTAGKYVGFVNDDTVYGCVYLERLVVRLEEGADLALCDFVHHGLNWQVIQAAPTTGRVDAATFLARRELILNTPWVDFGICGDGRYVEDMCRLHNPVVAHEPGVLALKG